MTSFDGLYLSPHLDDAVLSCGGQIHHLASLGQRIQIVSVMAAPAPSAKLSPAARQLHEVSELDDGDAVATRRREDEAACAAVDAEALHLDALDALYRRHPETGEPFYTSFKALFKPPHPADESSVDTLVERLAALPEAKRVCAPLGVGGHVDHVFVRRAAERVFGRRRLEYYEDYPYAHKRRALLKVLGRALLWDGAGGWQSRIWLLNHEDMEAKCRAISCYASQIGGLFGDEETMEDRVWSFANRVGGERLWWTGS